MKKTTIQLFKMMMIAALVAVTAAGCASRKPAPVAARCPLPSGHLIDQAFVTAKSTLSDFECRYKFDAVFAALMDICEGAPDRKNKELFSGFLVWAKTEGIISHIQATEYYTKYFSHRFVSLPGNYQTCSHCPRLKNLLGECWDEIRYKEQGLLKVCGDRSEYTKAHNDLQKIELILEATCRACAAE